MEIKENICINGLCDNRTEGDQLVCDECLEKVKEDFSEEFDLEPEVLGLDMEDFLGSEFP